MRIRAYKYHAIAMRHIGEMRRLMAQQNWPIVRRGSLECLNVLEIVLLQNFATTQIMLARPLETINVVCFSHTLLTPAVSIVFCSFF